MPFVCSGSCSLLFYYFYHIWARRPFWSCDQRHVIKFSFPCRRKFTCKFWFKMTQWYLKKKQQPVLFFICNDLWPRPRNDLDLPYSLTSINSIRCLHVQTFSPQAAILSEKFTGLTFSYRKACAAKFDLGVK